MYAARLSGANLSGTRLPAMPSSPNDTPYADVLSGGLVGTPVFADSTYRIVGGYLVGPQVNLTNAYLFAANLSGLQLQGVNFAGADLEYASLSGAKLGIANAPTNFAGTDLVGANLSGADLTGATWLSTKCPNGTVQSTACS